MIFCPHFIKRKIGGAVFLNTYNCDVYACKLCGEWIYSNYVLIKKRKREKK